MQQEDFAFRVVASTGQSQGSLETFPNGRFVSTPQRSYFLTFIGRGPHPHPLAPPSAVLVGYHLGVSSIPCAGHNAPRLEDRLFAFLPRAAGRRR
jgi:hypothetical protein